MNLHIFGDSWAAGAELEINENYFGYYLANSLNYDNTFNISESGNSLGIICKDVLDNIHNINSEDHVVVIVPPDVRWYTEDNGHFYAIYPDTKEWKNLVYPNKTIEWFKYHHSLFIFSIIEALKKTKAKFVLAHNYGSLDIKYDIVDKSYFLSELSLTGLLCGVDTWNNYPDDKFEDCGPVFPGQYFEGKDDHPNDLGHQKIAELLFNRFI